MEFLFNLTDRICRPNPKTAKNEQDAKFLLKRNRVLLILHIVSLLIVLLFYGTTNGREYEPWSLHFTLITIEIITFLALCRSHPFALKAFYFILLSLIGPYAISSIHEAFSLAWISIHVFPTFLLYTNGPSAYILQVILQIFYLKFLYKSYLTSLVIHSNPVVFAEHMVDVCVIGVLSNTLIMAITSYALKKANHEILVHKIKQADLERQKAFLLGFSHELRNITNSLLGNVQLALLEQISDKVKELLNSCEIFGGLLLHLINNALDIGKAEVGELEINPTSTAIYDTLEKIWNLSVQLIKNRQIEGHLRVQNQLPRMLKIDQYRLMQIIINLISNATKFTERGSVSMDVQWIEGSGSVDKKNFEPAPYDEEGIFEKNQSFSHLADNQIFANLQQKNIDKNKIQDSVTAKKGILKIIVRDTGCGIPEEKLPGIFNRTSEHVLHDPSRRLGTRLSLYITKCLVERMNGEIKAYTRINKGTTFILCLPIEVAEENKIKKPLKEHEIKDIITTSNLQVLVVDDIQFNRVILSNYLKNLGVRTPATEARNGQEAFDIFKGSVNIRNKQSFNINTMDVEMPVLDGKKAVELIRNYEHEYKLNPCLIIMVSGNCSESEISECLNPSRVTGLKNADFFLKKPISIDDLSNVITSWYQKKLSL